MNVRSLHLLGLRPPPGHRHRKEAGRPHPHARPVCAVPDTEPGSTAGLTSPGCSRLGSNWPVRTELFMTSTLGSAGAGLGRPAGRGPSGALRGAGLLAFLGSGL